MLSVTDARKTRDEEPREGVPGEVGRGDGDDLPVVRGQVAVLVGPEVRHTMGDRLSLPRNQGADERRHELVEEIVPIFGWNPRRGHLHFEFGGT